MSLLPTYRHEGNRPERQMKEIVIRRRLECINCGRFYYSMKSSKKYHLMAAKKNGRRELFDRGKLLNRFVTFL